MIDSCTHKIRWKNLLYRPNSKSPGGLPWPAESLPAWRWLRLRAAWSRSSCPRRSRASRTREGRPGEDTYTHTSKTLSLSVYIYIYIYIYICIYIYVCVCVCVCLSVCVCVCVHLRRRKAACAMEKGSGGSLCKSDESLSRQTWGPLIRSYYSTSFRPRLEDPSHWARVPATCQCGSFDWSLFPD